ncbi:hypothetical protein HXA35_20605 [Bacillus sp. A301a_S52]|jgi:hypothetical protein|uniref:hypothetical protein n=1 Tax=Salipaludibacillus agaradhaerens TaxID=76935 RepID=UPI001475B88C|nr:hypothetical protein [Salipaludibacillus agaradhaerens]MCR6112735.1 hypothetical protein [Bacillus sp. A301a_S52]
MTQPRSPHINQFSKEAQEIVYKIVAKALIRKAKAEQEQKEQQEQQKKGKVAQ